MNLFHHPLLKSILFVASVAIVGCSSPTTESAPPQEQQIEQEQINATPTPEEKTPLKEKAPAPKMELDTIVLPATFSKVAEAQGDLNKDGQPELVLVVDDLQSAGDFGISRSILIYRLENRQWKQWEEFRGGILDSEAGGMMGDPFEGIEIDRGSIVIHHFGGSRYKWRYTHRFRHQNGRWELIGATVLYGTPCEYWKTYDYNLSTSKVEVEEIYEDCDTEKETTNTFSFRHAIKPLPDLHGFIPGETAVAVPEREDDFYF
ncbi:MAG: hypothetical protein ACRBG0_19610 [Lewinella sp.]|uniref:hypothetical protein n=1 Tax=Lewinella sp. TaxID=2004506 RepID=UPI003D6C2E60